MLHGGQRATLAAYESYIDLSGTLFVLVDSQFDFISAAHEPAASINSRGSAGMMGHIKTCFRFTQNIKASMTEAELIFSNQTRKAGLGCVESERK